MFIISWKLLPTFLTYSSGTFACPPTAPAPTTSIPFTVRLRSNTAPFELSAINAVDTYNPLIDDSLSKVVVNGGDGAKLPPSVESSFGTQFAVSWLSNIYLSLTKFTLLSISPNLERML